jgi:hypothetical protein
MRPQFEFHGSVSFVLVADITASARRWCYTRWMTLTDNALVTVDKHIVGAVHRISQQRAVIEKLRDHDRDLKSAKRLLRAMERTLEEFQTYRRLIEDEAIDAKGIRHRGGGLP